MLLQYQTAETGGGKATLSLCKETAAPGGRQNTSLIKDALK